MSLLLEALKKAELAQQSPPSAPAAEAIRLEPRPAAAEPRPDPEPEASAQTHGMDPGERTHPEREPARREPFAAEERNAAAQVFAAKEIAYPRARGFHVVVGVLIAAGAGYAGYVWWQMQPRTTAARPQQVEAPRASAAPQVREAPQAPAVAMIPPQQPAPLPTPVAAGNRTVAATAPEARPAPPATPVFTRRTAVEAAAPTSAHPASGRAAHADAASITVAPSVLLVDPSVERAYDAYLRDDLPAARESYQQALQRDPLNRDALLGLAAIDMRSRRFDAAEARYLRLLELDPRDATAQAGLISLRGQLNPVQSESHLKMLIAANPDAPNLHFALGNQYAQQGRWNDAQAAYFKAYSADPENADFAYNLAVSLDQMRQKKPAIEYYRRALALAATGSAGFDRKLASTRLQELQRP